MVEALLMQGLLELVIRGPAVVDHDAVVVQSQDVLGHATAACRVNDVSRGLRADQRVQPGRVSSDSPSGFIGHHPVGLSHRLPDGLIDRLAAACGAQDGMYAAAATEPDTEKALQAASDFAVRQTTLLVEFDDSGLGIRSQLGGSGAESVGGL